MKLHSKIGNQKGRPAYRTPSYFKNNIFRIVSKIPKGKILMIRSDGKLGGYNRGIKKKEKLLQQKSA